MTKQQKTLKEINKTLREMEQDIKRNKELAKESKGIMNTLYTTISLQIEIDMEKLVKIKNLLE